MLHNNQITQNIILSPADINNLLQTGSIDATIINAEQGYIVFSEINILKSHTEKTNISGNKIMISQEDISSITKGDELKCKYLFDGYEIIH